MNRIKKKMDNEASRNFWDSFPKNEDENQSTMVLPSLGESWWEAETDLSISLLSLKEKDKG